MGISGVNYIDENPTLFKHDKALEIAKHARLFLKQFVIIGNRRYKFTIMDDYKYVYGTDTSSTCLLFGTLLSDDCHTMVLSLDKIIDLFQNQ